MLILPILLLFGVAAAGAQKSAADQDSVTIIGKSSSRTWPQPGQHSLVALYRCIFKQNTCHFLNQHNMNKFKHFVNENRPIYNANSALLLDLADDEARKYSGGRLITHYYPAEFTNTCLQLEFMWLGPPMAERRLNVIQQDKLNKCIYSDIDSPHSPGRNNQWRKVSLQLDVTDGQPRFFIEVVYDPRKTKKGEYFILKEFTYLYGNCLVNDANKCQV